MNARGFRWISAVLCSFLLSAAALAATTHTVQISDSNDDLQFFPSSIQINVGDTVTWNWNNVNHSTTSGSCATGSCIPDGNWDSGINANPHTFSQTFNSKGTFPYFCRVHGQNFNMRGTVTVVQPLPPDYSISIPNGSGGTIFPNQTATFSGRLTTQTSFTSSVSLTCGTGAPSTCSINPSSAVPSSNGTPFTVTAGSTTAGTFNFVVQGTGTDAAHTMHSSQPLTLSVANFNLSALSNVTLSSNATSPPQPFTVSGSNFTGIVSLSCTGPGGGALPVGVTCGFSTNPVNLSPGAASVNDSFTLTTSHTLQGSYTIMVNASTTSVPNAPTISQSFTLNVQADYQLSISNSPVPVFPGQGGTFTGTITPLDGYTGTITIICGPFDSVGNSITCTPPAASIAVQGANPVNFSVNFATNANSQTTAPKDYTANISASDTNALAHSQPAIVRVVDFTLTAPNGTTVNVPQGNPSAPIALTVSALGQFDSQATLSCSSGLPSGATCFFSPSATVRFSPGSPGTVNLIINSGSASVSSGNPVTITATVPQPASANTVHVLVGNLVSGYYTSYPTFGPSSVTVNPSDTVEWNWADTGHTSTSGSCAAGSCTPDNNWDSGVTPLNQGATFSHAFQTPGSSFSYFCRVHGPMFGMVGTVQVNTAPPVRTQQLTLNITGGSGTTNLSVAAAHIVKVPVQPDPAPVGGTVEFTVSVSQSGTAPANPVMFVSFSEPVTIVSTLPGGCSSVSGGISCAIASFPASPFVFDVVVPFSRAVTAQAFIRSDAANTGSPDQAFETVQIRPRPFARQGLPPKLP